MDILIIALLFKLIYKDLRIPKVKRKLYGFIALWSLSASLLIIGYVLVQIQKPDAALFLFFAALIFGPAIFAYLTFFGYSLYKYKKAHKLTS